MIYKFGDIHDEELYDTAMAVIITGPHSIFNNIVVDRLREKCMEEESEDDVQLDSELLDEFGIEDTGDRRTYNYIDFNTFLDTVNIPSLSGKWFCSVDIKMLNKKQLEKFDKYLKTPNKNGILVVVSHDFKDYRKYLRNNVLRFNKNSHVIQLSFPNRKGLLDIIKVKFNERGVDISSKSIELFMMKMGKAYNEYDNIINRVCMGYSGKMDFDEVKQRLKGVDNYDIDDFVRRLLKPINKNKISKNRKIYKVVDSLLSEMSATDIVNKLRYMVDEFVEFKIAIIRGIIPIKVRFSVVEAKRKLGKESKLYKVPDFLFRRKAYIASLTSLRDWTYMKILLGNVKLRYDDNENERVLYTLIHRSILNTSRLRNNIGLEDVLNIDINRIDKWNLKKCRDK